MYLCGLHGENKLYIFVHLEVKVNSLIVFVVLKNDETVLQVENQHRYVTRTIKLK